MKVELKGLTKTFPSRNKKDKTPVVAVSDFTYEFPDGKMIGLLGPSGCGKSTTLYMICGLLKPDSGKIFFGEEDVTNLEPENRGVGLVFQNYALYPHLSVRKNILFPLQNLKGKEKLSKEEMNKRVEDAAKIVQIEGLLERKPGELSGGQQQRVAIARALVKMPPVLLLDEPLSNLDARLRLQTREELKRIQVSTGITTIFVTHDQEEAMSISDEIVVMNDGKVQQVGKPQKVYDDPENLFVAKFLGTPPINVFTGKIKNQKLLISGKEVLSLSKMENGVTDVLKTSVSLQPDQEKEVYIGIRPEGFCVKEEGRFVCQLRRVEVMGRDVSVVASHKDCENEQIRAIINSSQKIDTTKQEIGFELKPDKVYIFDKETQERM